ncbi:hypothetical protein Tco_1247322 [Tanacetum coccineum]
MVVCKIGKPWGIIITTKGNHPKCLERKCFRNFLFLELTLMGIFKSGKRGLRARFSAPFYHGNDIQFFGAAITGCNLGLAFLLSKQDLEKEISTKLVECIFSGILWKVLHIENGIILVVKAHVILLPSQLLVNPKNEGIIEEIIQNYYDREDGETTPRFKE